jgi:hypothetical protein
MRAIVVVIAGLTLLNVSSAQAATPETRDSATITAFAPQATDFSAAKRRKKHARPSPQSNFEAIRGQAFGAERAAVACTRSGCQGVPRGCLREPERSFNGEPTGFDSIVCPPR